MKQQQESKHDWRATIILLLLLCVALAEVYADPTGAGVVNVTPALGAPTVSPSLRNDSRGTITTILLNSTTQTSRWKAYVGNVSGSLALQNPSNYSIYSWDLTTITGEVYASRHSNIGWTGLTCANTTGVQQESEYFAMQATHPDRINATFNWSIHKQFEIGSSVIIPQNTCNGTVTNINNVRVVPTVNSPYQEIMLRDSNGYMVYLTDISAASTGFDGQKYDFQLIVPENASISTTPYYFFAELG